MSWDCYLSPGASVTTACGTEAPPHCAVNSSQNSFRKQEASTILSHLFQCGQALAAGTEPTLASLDYPHLYSGPSSVRC